MGNEYQNSLMHYGIQGMKWGVRRFQNPDGTLTPEGRERYGKAIYKSGGSYLNPRKPGDKRYANRQAVQKQYEEEWNDSIRQGKFNTNEPSIAEKKLWDKYKIPYIKATLKDLKIVDTPETRKLVDDYLAKFDEAYEYFEGKEYVDGKWVDPVKPRWRE